MAERYFTLINILLITAFVGISTGTFYNVVTTTIGEVSRKPAKVKRQEMVRTRASKKKSLAYYNPVEKRNLFNTDAGEQKKKTDALDLAKMEQTDLQLTLWGTISGGSMFSWAVIEEKKSRKQALYKVGDVIENATLTHVLRNKVVLNLNGKDQVLEIKESKGRSSRRGASSSSSSRSNQSSKKITVERTQIDESLKDLNKLMKDVRIRPHFKDGESDGLIISGIRGNSVFKKLGLRNGDIIMGVDGARIESVDDAMKLYGGLKNMESMKVEIKRRGRVQTLDFEIK